MAKINLKLLNLSDLKVTPAQEKPIYVFIKASGETIGDTQNTPGTFINRPNDGFTNLIRKITMKNDEVN